MDDPAAARSRLIRILQHAYSGERAAGYAYRGHSRASRDPEERAHIARIEAEEWHHREQVGRLLRELGAAPRRARELRAVLVGRTLQVLCRVIGWFAPMYGAGRLESRNIVEYEDAARDAVACGRADFVDCLLEMAEVEWDHEAYFRSKVTGHALTRLFPVWSPPPPREAIRAAYRTRETGAA
jgi:rubrerythrin